MSTYMDIQEIPRMSVKIDLPVVILINKHNTCVYIETKICLCLVKFTHGLK